MPGVTEYTLSDPAFHTPLPCLCTSSTWMFTFTKLHLLHLLFKLWFRKLFFLSSVYTYTTSSFSYSKEDAVVEVVASTELFSESWGLFYLLEASVHVLRNSPTSEQNMTYVTLDVMYFTSNTDVTGCQSKCQDWQWSRGCALIQTSGTTAGWLLLSTRDNLTGTNNHTKIRTLAKQRDLRNPEHWSQNLDGEGSEIMSTPPGGRVDG